MQHSFRGRSPPAFWRAWATDPNAGRRCQSTAHAGRILRRAAPWRTDGIAPHFAGVTVSRCGQRRTGLGRIFFSFFFFFFFFNQREHGHVQVSALHKSLETQKNLRFSAVFEKTRGTRGKQNSGTMLQGLVQQVYGLTVSNCFAPVVDRVLTALVSRPGQGRHV